MGPRLDLTVGWGGWKGGSDRVVGLDNRDGCHYHLLIYFFLLALKEVMIKILTFYLSHACNTSYQDMGGPRIQGQGLLKLAT